MLLHELLEKLSQEDKDKFYGDVMRKSRIFPFSSLADSVFPNQKDFKAEPKKGTVELLSPEGEVLMRDGELLENEPKITYTHTFRFS